MTKSSLLRKKHSTSDSLELVHIDLCRPMRVESYYGDGYFILLLDHYSRIMKICFWSLNLMLFAIFKWYKARVEKETSK